MSHVRSAGTSTPVAQSRGELERILARYGCTRFGFDRDDEAQRIQVWFSVPDSKLGGGEFVPVRIEVSLRDVGARLDALLSPLQRRRGLKTDPAQVERVAWRHIVLLVEAGLVAAEAGISRVSEFFLAHTLVQGPEGPARVIDVLREGGTLPRALLPRGTP